MLIDARHGLKPNDEEALAALDKAAVSYQIVLTKADKAKGGDLPAVVAATQGKIAKRPAAHPQVLATSAATGGGIAELQGGDRRTALAPRLSGCRKPGIDRRLRRRMTTMSQTTDQDTVEAIARARLISAALPYMLAYDGKVVVVKYGGHAMGDPDLSKAFARDITLLETSGARPVVVHGGGPQIADMLKRLDIKSEFRSGLRVTDKRTVEVVEMVLAGSINKEIVMAINAEGGKAVGLSGKDGNMVFAEKVTRTEVDPDSNIEKVVDLGFVGEPKTVNRAVIDMVLSAELIPVIAPVAPGLDGETYNVNADTFAGAIAGALGASRLLFLTDVPGVLDKDGTLIKELTVAQVHKLIADGTISGGMIPKVETCIAALEGGVEGVVILNGKTPHAVLLELYTDHGAGTLILP